MKFISNSKMQLIFYKDMYKSCAWQEKSAKGVNKSCFGKENNLYRKAVPAYASRFNR